MQYLKELPEITSVGIKGNGNVELEVEGEVQDLPNRGEAIVFNGDMEDSIYMVVGKLVEHEIIDAEESYSGKPFTRMEIKGVCVAVTAPWGE